MKCWWCHIFIYSERALFFTEAPLSLSLSLSLSLISSHTTAVSLNTTGLSTCLLRTIQQNTRLTHTHSAGLIHLSPCGKVPLTASCAQGLYFHTSIMETLECSTANAQQVGLWRYVMVSDAGRSRWQYRRVCDYDKIVESGQTCAILYTTENISLSYFSV